MIPQGRRTRTAPIPDSFWQNVWDNANGLPSGLPRVAPRSPDLRQPGQRIFERIGSNTNPSHFVLLRDSVNAIKGRLEGFTSPINVDTWERYVDDAAGQHGSELDVMIFMAPLRDVRPLPCLTDWKVTCANRTFADSRSVPVFARSHGDGAHGRGQQWHP